MGFGVTGEGGMGTPEIRDGFETGCERVDDGPAGSGPEKARTPRPGGRGVRANADMWRSPYVRRSSDPRVIEMNLITHVMTTATRFSHTVREPIRFGPQCQIKQLDEEHLVERG